MFLLALATAIAGIFFGAALYVSLVEHPARVSAGIDVAVRQFRPSYRRGAAMQGALAALGFGLGLAAAWRLSDLHVAISALLLGLPIPVTLWIIAPTNRRLVDPSLDAGGSEAGQLLARWGRLHWIRTILGGLAFLLFLLRLVARTP